MLKQILYSLLLIAASSSFCHSLTEEELRDATQRYVTFLAQAGNPETIAEWYKAAIEELFSENFQKISKKRGSAKTNTANREQYIAALEENKRSLITWSIKAPPTITNIKAYNNSVTITYQLLRDDDCTHIFVTQTICFTEDSQILAVESVS